MEELAKLAVEAYKHTSQGAEACRKQTKFDLIALFHAQ